MVENPSSPEQLAQLPPGYDREDPYEGENIEKYPDWWRENIEEFRAHNMRPYRPPRFEDGEVVPELIRKLEERLKIDVKIRKKNPQTEGDSQSQMWEILVDGNSLSTIPRYRSPKGYTAYNISSEQFVHIVESRS